MEPWNEDSAANPSGRAIVVPPEVRPEDSDGNWNYQRHQQDRCLQSAGAEIGRYSENAFDEIHGDLTFTLPRRIPRGTSFRNYHHAGETLSYK